MATARKYQIYLDLTPYYYCTNKCINKKERRTFLSGTDPKTKINYDKRKLWVINKIEELQKIFSISICSYAVVEDSYHLVVKSNHEEVNLLSNEEIINRWSKIFISFPPFVQQYISGELKAKTKIKKAEKSISEMRIKMADISWFMRCLNEDIARTANVEDNVAGRFWHQRYETKALLDKTAIIIAMNYVDLLPIINNEVTTLAKCSTSVKARIKTHKNNKEKTFLLPIKTKYKANSIDFDLDDYINIINWTSKGILGKQPKKIKDEILASFKKLPINFETWTNLTQNFVNKTSFAVGNPSNLNNFNITTGKKFCKSISFSRELYLD